MEYKGSLSAEGKKVAIVVSRTHEFVTVRMLEGAKDCLLRHGADEKNIDVFWVPGSFEIPLLMQTLAQTKKYHGLMCVGVVLKGATTHNQLIGAEAAKGVAHISLNFGIPVGFGITNAENLEQAIERAGSKVGNRGWDAALTVIEMMNICSTVKQL